MFAEPPFVLVISTGVEDQEMATRHVEHFFVAIGACNGASFLGSFSPHSLQYMVERAGNPRAIPQALETLRASLGSGTLEVNVIGERGEKEGERLERSLAG